MIKFYNDYAGKGLAMIGINSNETEGHPTDSFDHMIGHAKEKGFKWPYVRDDSQEIMAFEVRRGARPHYYVFDQDRKLRYTGRMDDSPLCPGKETTHELPACRRR